MWAPENEKNASVTANLRFQPRGLSICLSGFAFGVDIWSWIELRMKRLGEVKTL